MLDDMVIYSKILNTIYNLNVSKKYLLKFKAYKNCEFKVQLNTTSKYINCRIPV